MFVHVLDYDTNQKIATTIYASEFEEGKEEYNRRFKIESNFPLQVGETYSATPKVRFHRGTLVHGFIHQNDRNYL